MIWRVYEVEDGKKYRLHLFQASNGLRSFRLVEVDSGEDLQRPGDVAFATKVVQNDLLRVRDLGSIAESTELESGKKYMVDVHGTWLTDTECKQLQSRISFHEVRWDTALPPSFAPK